ncbi:MAG: MBOAT family protein, partial [Lachnospiraceae bacterium]|nr:MBOAT family protein [Lachnospiraceae bacterium]
MQFSGLPFLFCFLPAMLLIYLLTPKKLKNTALFLGSILFYAWGEKRLVFLFLLAILLNYLFGLWIGK